MTMTDRPGARIASRPLHFIWLLDCSESMRLDGKIEALNQAVRAALPALEDAARTNPHAQVLVRGLAFSTGVRWALRDPTPIDQVRWADVHAAGYTDLGAALSEVARVLHVPPMEERALPPAIVLVSDGQPTDDFTAGLRALMSEPWGKKAVRLAVGIGRDADLDVLQRFIGHSEVKPLAATNPEQLVHFLRWASTVAAQVASQPMHPGEDRFPPPPPLPGPPPAGAPPEVQPDRPGTSLPSVSPASDDLPVTW